MIMMMVAQVTMIWAVAVAIFCVGGMIGGSIVAIVADNLGRKKGLLYNNVLVLIATILMGKRCSTTPFVLLLVIYWIRATKRSLGVGYGLHL